jgi:hypothetical protein
MRREITAKAGMKNAIDTSPRFSFFSHPFEQCKRWVIIQ